jgi:hypothetical protein
LGGQPPTWQRLAHLHAQHGLNHARRGRTFPRPSVTATFNVVPFNDEVRCGEWITSAVAELAALELAAIDFANPTITVDDACRARDQ